MASSMPFPTLGLPGAGHNNDSPGHRIRLHATVALLFTTYVRATKRCRDQFRHNLRGNTGSLSSSTLSVYGIGTVGW